MASAPGQILDFKWRMQQYQHDLDLLDRESVNLDQIKLRVQILAQVAAEIREEEKKEVLHVSD